MSEKSLSDVLAEQLMQQRELAAIGCRKAEEAHEELLEIMKKYIVTVENASSLKNACHDLSHQWHKSLMSENSCEEDDE